MRAAERRGVAALGARLAREFGERRAALERPVEESEARIERLRAVVAEGERALEALGPRLRAVEERLARAFESERDRFFCRALPRPGAS